MKVEFGPWLPDQPIHAAPGLEAIANAYPGSSGYRPVGQWQAMTSALPTRCLGASSFVSPGGVSAIIAGTGTDLYRQTSSGWTSIKSGFSLQGSNRWRFAQFGGLAIATSEADPMQKINLVTGDVAPLGGSPPRFRMLGVVQNFLVGGVRDGATNEIGWSGENDAEFWTPGSRKSDYNIFPDGGEVTGIISGEFGLILQRNAVRRMSYVGGNVLFRFDKIASNVGCVTMNSVAQAGEIAFWYADDGFKMWDGAQIVPIGFEQVDQTFAATYDVSSWPVMSSAIDPSRSSVCWSMGDSIWLYNWRLKQWSIIALAAEIVFSGVTKTLSIDEQDPDVGAPDDNLDAPGLDSLDADRFRGGDPLFYIVAADHRLGVLSGANMAATFGMRQIELTEKRDARLRRIRPMSDLTAGATLTLEARQRIGDAPAQTVWNTLNASGEMPVRTRGRFVKPTLDIAAGQAWSFAQGLDLTLTAGGAR